MNPLEAIGGFLFGSPKNTPTSTLSADQKTMMGALGEGSSGAIGDLYGTLGNLSGNSPSAYDALPDFEGTFQQQFGNPMRQQYEGDLNAIKNSDELFSGSTTASNFRANQKFNSGMASARAGMMMQERAKQQQSQENAYSRQLNASQLLSSLSTAGLKTKAQENVVSQTPGALSMISGVAQAVKGVAGLF